MLAQNPLTLLFRWHGQLEYHVEAAYEGRIESVNEIGQPERRHGILFEHPVDPRLPNLGRAFSTEEPVAIVEDILDLVESNECLALRKETLGGAKRTQAAFAIHWVTVGIFASHLEQFTTQFISQCACQLTLAGARRAMQEDVYAAPPGRGRVP